MVRGRNKKLVEVLTFLMQNDGDSLDWVAELSASRGVAPPNFIDTRPELKRHLEFYWSAFNDLMTDTDQYGSIRWSALDSYARRYSVNFETFRYIIRALERARHDARK